MSSNWEISDIITIVVVLDMLYNNFYTIIASLLETRNKMINEIQCILQSKKAQNINKYAIE